MLGQTGVPPQMIPTPLPVGWMMGRGSGSSHLLQLLRVLLMQSGNLLPVLMCVSLFDGLLACLFTWLGRCIKCMHTAYKECIGQCRTHGNQAAYV